MDMDIDINAVIKALTNLDQFNQMFFKSSCFQCSV